MSGNGVSRGTVSEVGKFGIVRITLDPDSPEPPAPGSRVTIIERADAPTPTGPWPSNAQRCPACSSATIRLLGEHEDGTIERTCDACGYQGASR